MKSLIYLGLTFSLLGFTHCKGGKAALEHKGISSQSDCTAKNGYWYNGKCWKNFEDEGIAKSDIDRVVVEQMQQIDAAVINFGGKKYPILSFNVAPEKDNLIMFLTFKDNDKENTVLLGGGIKMADVQAGKPINAGATYLTGNLEDDKNLQERILGKGYLKGEPLGGELNYRFTGDLTNPKDNKVTAVDFTFSEAISGAGGSTLEIRGNEAILNGDLGTRTYAQMRDLIQNHPEVKTIVMGSISGSVNDAVNMHTGRILNEAGLNTKVLANSDIASGGVDLFCAGKERIVEKGAKIGIHSWCCVDDLTAIQLPKEHPAHQYQIEYFTMCLGKEMGPAFYFHTLSAAPFDDVHWMSDADIKKWGVSTRFVE